MVQCLYFAFEGLEMILVVLDGVWMFVKNLGVNFCCKDENIEQILMLFSLLGYTMTIFKDQRAVGT